MTPDNDETPEAIVWELEQAGAWERWRRLVEGKADGGLLDHLDARPLCVSCGRPVGEFRVVHGGGNSHFICRGCCGRRG